MSSTRTQLICHNFGGIRQKNAVFTSELITAQDMQNIELYYTGINNGVGIRTAKGNVSINDSLAGTEKIMLKNRVLAGIKVTSKYRRD